MRMRYASWCIAGGLLLAVASAGALSNEAGNPVVLVTAVGSNSSPATGHALLNAVEIYARKRAEAGDTSPPAQPMAGAGSPEVIFIERQLVAMEPGETDSTLVRLFNSAVPLFGYSLALRAEPLGKATGSVTVTVRQTGFYPLQHLILADPLGAPLDPFFSVILPWESNGVFINANTELGYSVLAALDVNDMLAEVVFEASLDAQGIFAWGIGPASVLADGNGQPVPFTFCGGRVAVGVPADRPADLNGDGVVDFADLIILLAGWGACPPQSVCPTDLNCDGVTDFGDLVVLLSEWG